MSEQKRDLAYLAQLQAAPLEKKIVMTKQRIREWVEHYGLDHVYVSFSGGKDSTVLVDIARQMYPDIRIAFMDTSLEFPEIRDFVRSYGDDIDWVKPKMNFRETIVKYGYPIFSKEICESVYGARRWLQKVRERAEGKCSAEQISNYTAMADMLGVDRRENKENAEIDMLKAGVVPDGYVQGNNRPESAYEWYLRNRSGAGLSNDSKEPIRIQQLEGKYNDKTGRASLYNKVKWQFMLYAPFEISNQCCRVMKKNPAHSYAHQTKRHAITAEMTCESKLRQSKWMANGCNGFDMAEPKSVPMAFWLEKDVLEYVRKYDLNIASVYGDVIEDRGNSDTVNGQLYIGDLVDISHPNGTEISYKTTQCSRTGCVACGFGIQFDSPSCKRLYDIEMYSNKKLLDWFLRGGAFNESGIWQPDNRGLGFWFVYEWINQNGNLGRQLDFPHRERYISTYNTEETKKYLYGKQRFNP